MKNAELLNQRLINQQIAGTTFKHPVEIVSWLGAMQAQEFAMAKWAIGLRLPGLNEADVDDAFNKGSILRTHFLRPTWHFVCPEDIRWMLKLTAPRVNAFNAYMYRKTELDAKLFNRCNNIIEKKLSGGNFFTRTVLKEALEKKGIVGDGVRLSCIMMQAELEGIICSGPREGKQFTYALLEERVAPAKELSNDEALAAMASRYFTSRGPATLQDFVWWSGLTTKDAKAGIASLGDDFIHEVIDGKEFVFKPAAGSIKDKSRKTFLLPDYDEYGISYKDRSALFPVKNNFNQHKSGNSIFSHMIVIDGAVAGTWQRIMKGNEIGVETTFYNPLTNSEQREVEKAVKRYTSFFK